MFLPDTNIFIRAFHKKEAETTFLNKAITQNKLAISVVVIAEFFPRALPEELNAFYKLLDIFQIIEIDREIAEVAGQYRKDFVRKTKRIFVVDCFLAAQARVHNLILVTNNRPDFPMKDIKIIPPFLI